MSRRLVYLTQAAAFMLHLCIVTVQGGDSPPAQVNRVIALNPSTVPPRNTLYRTAEKQQLYHLKKKFKK